VLVLAAVTGGCGGNGGTTTLDGDPGSYLITLSQLPSPDFAVYQAVKPVGPGWLDEASSTAVRKDGLVRAVAVEYYRDESFSTSNGAITLTVAVASFATTTGAATAMLNLGTALDATTTQGTVEGVGALQIVVVWRVDNLINSLVAEGRLGGLQLDQILPVATAQTANERAG
jgi:hypothetical protein